MLPWVLVIGAALYLLRRSPAVADALASPIDTPKGEGPASPNTYTDGVPAASTGVSGSTGGVSGSPPPLVATTGSGANVLSATGGGTMAVSALPPAGYGAGHWGRKSGVSGWVWIPDAPRTGKAPKPKVREHQHQPAPPKSPPPPPTHYTEYGD